MKQTLKLPVELDAPEKQHIGIGIFYGFVAFFALPYFVYFLMADLQDPYLLTWFELGYHVINFGIAFGLFREYLMDGLFTFRLQLKEFLFSIKLALLIIAALVAIVYVAASLCGVSWLFSTLMAVFPVSEMEVLFFGGELVFYNPLLSFICAVVLSPLSITCLFYCVSFVPAFRVRPWLGYLAVAVWIGFTHINNAVTSLDVFTEIGVFIPQLPIHIIACWSFRRTNNVWTPMVTLAFANLLAWAYLFVLFLAH